jgi:hypothetical protein
MPNVGIEEFAKLLIREVRDEAIRSCDRKLRQDAKGHVAKRWKDLPRGADPETVASVIIPDIVDAAISQLLRAIDDGVVKLSFTPSDAERVDLNEAGLGELTGWYMGIPGWRSAYSEERYIDDSSDLRDFIKNSPIFNKKVGGTDPGEAGGSA